MAARQGEDEATQAECTQAQAEAAQFDATWLCWRGWTSWRVQLAGLPGACPGVSRGYSHDQLRSGGWAPPSTPTTRSGPRSRSAAAPTIFVCVRSTILTIPLRAWSVPSPTTAE